MGQYSGGGRQEEERHESAGVSYRVADQSPDVVNELFCNSRELQVCTFQWHYFQSAPSESAKQLARGLSSSQTCDYQPDVYRVSSALLWSIAPAMTGEGSQANCLRRIGLLYFLRNRRRLMGLLPNRQKPVGARRRIPAIDRWSCKDEAIARFRHKKRLQSASISTPRA